MRDIIQRTADLRPYQMPLDVPHRDQLRPHEFMLPRSCSTGGIVIMLSGIPGNGQLQPAAMGLDKDFLFLNTADGIRWWKSFTSIRRVSLQDMSNLSIPLRAPDGQMTHMSLGPRAKGLSITYDGGFDDVEAMLAMFHPSHAVTWLGLINAARQRFMDSTGGGPARPSQ